MFKVKNKVSSERMRTWFSFWQSKIVFCKTLEGVDEKFVASEASRERINPLIPVESSPTVYCVKCANIPLI